jgi:hypothetical protein
MSDQIKKDEMGGACNTRGSGEEYIKTLIRGRGENRPPERHWRILEDIIKMYHNGTECETVNCIILAPDSVQL